MSAEKADLEKRPIEFDEGVISNSSENISFGEETGSKNIFHRVIDGFKPPLDDAQHSHLTPQEKAQLYLGRKKPSMSRRHLIIISLSSCVGTGLFIGSGSSYTAGGPASLLIGFGVLGICLICTMASVGEVSLRYPTVNVFYEIPSRFLHPSWGFAIGWIYCWCWMVTCPLELIAAAELTQYWRNDDNAAARASPVAWVAIIYVFNLIVNVSGSHVYAELEFLVGLIKITAVTGFIIFTVIVTAGGPPLNHYIGGSNWHDPSAFTHSFKGVIYALVSCSFAYGGTEVSGIAAAETANPVRAIPSAVRQAFWRILIFFMVGILMVCFLVNPHDSVGNSNEGSGSPWIVALQNTRVRALPSIFNAVIICSVIGVSNAAMYAATRSLTALAIQGANLKFFCYIDRQGRPIFSFLAVAIFSALAFVAASDKYNDVFNWLYAFAALAFLFVWFSIDICHLRMRWAFKVQGKSLSELVYKSPFGIWGSIIGAGIALFTFALQFWIYIFPLGESADAETFFQNDLSVPCLLALLIGHKIYYRKTAVFVSNADLDIDSGVRIIDRDELEAENIALRKSMRKNPLKMLSYYLC